MLKIWYVAWRVTLASLILSTPGLAQDTGTPSSETLENVHPERPYSPYAGGAVPTRVAYDAKYYGLGILDGVEMVAQQRAYTSPIWYTP